MFADINVAEILFFCRIIFIFAQKCQRDMYIIKPNNENVVDLSLKDLLSKFIEETGVPLSAIADEIGVHKETLTKFQNGEAELKFMQAVRLMKVLGLTNEQMVEAYCRDFSDAGESSISGLEQISYIRENFCIPTLRKIGIIKPRAKMNEYAEQICSFFGFSSIYEYDDTSISPTLFSKSRRKVLEEKEEKMTNFWLKCAISSFLRIDNPNEFDRNLLIQLVKRTSEFTADEVNGYHRFVLVLYQIGITVLTQPYISGTKSHGGTIIVAGKPCIVITDMGKKFHKLWISLLHELYHVINDYEMLESIEYHFSTPDYPDLLMNEQKADQFALNILINPAVQQNLSKVINFPYKVKELSYKLGVSASIVYGVYLESLPDGREKQQLFAKLSHFLLPSDVAIKNILFDPIGKKSLEEAINKMRSQLNRKAI